MAQYDYVEIKDYGTRPSEFVCGALFSDECNVNIRPEELEDVLQDIVDDLERQIAVYKRRLEIVKAYGASSILEAATIIKWFPKRADKSDHALFDIWHQEEEQ